MAVTGLFFKLGSLAIRTLSKPLAQSFKKRAHTSPLVKKAFTLCGQKAHEAEFRIRARLLGHRIHTVKPLEDKTATARGADIIGEVIVFSVAAGIIVFEIVRKSFADEAKAEETKRIHLEENNAIAARFNMIESRLYHIESSLANMSYDSGQVNESIESLRQEMHDIMVSLDSTHHHTKQYYHVPKPPQP